MRPFPQGRSTLLLSLLIAATACVVTPRSATVYAAQIEQDEALPDDTDEDVPIEEEDESSLRVDFPATVERIRSQRDIEVRGGNGRLYNVEYAEVSKRFEVGSLVRVVGVADGLAVKRALLFARLEEKMLPRTGDPQQPAEVDFPAHFTGIDKQRGRAIVRGDDGNEYRLRGDEVEEYEVGDRVRVQGLSRYGVVEVRTLELIP